MSEQVERQPAGSGLAEPGGVASEYEPAQSWPGGMWPRAWPPMFGQAWPYLVGGVCALLTAGLLAYLTLRDTEPGNPGSAASGQQVVRTPEVERVVHRRGGFAVAAPTRMRVTREGRTLQLVTGDRSLVVTVGPGAPGALGRGHRAFLGELRSQYGGVSLIGTERTKIDGRRSVSTAGVGVNSNRVQIRFVIVTVAARPRNFTIAAYTARDSDPAITLPLVNAIADGFELLP